MGKEVDVRNCNLKMNNTGKVGEIFHAAGTAFTTLGDLTSDLKGSKDKTAPGSGSKWTDAELDALHKAVHNFANDLNEISQTIKNRTVSQIQGALERKAFAEAGIDKLAIQEQSTSQQQQILKQKVANVSN